MFDFFDKTLRFKTVVKLENQPREKIREWFKALDRSKMFEGFEMFVCLIIGFGNYHGFHCNDEEFLSFHEIYKHTKDKFGDKPKVILVDISHVPNSRGNHHFILFSSRTVSVYVLRTYYSKYYTNNGFCNNLAIKREQFKEMWTKVI